MDELRSAMTQWLVGGARCARLPLIIGGAAVLLLSVTLNAVWTRPAPLQNTFATPKAAAEAVIGAMHAGNLDRLRVFALTKEEFRAHVWPYLPAARPERNVPFEFVWDMLQQNSEGHLRQNLERVGQAPLEVRAVRFAAETSAYGDVVVRRDTEIVVATADGTERVVRLFGSVVEQQGAWKVFSYVVND